MASSFGTAWCLTKVAHTFAISHSHSHILRTNANLSFHRTLTSHLLSVSTSSVSGVSQTVQAFKGDVDVLLKGVVEKSVAKEVKHILEMALSCFCPLIHINTILDRFTLTMFETTSELPSISWAFQARRASLKREILHTDFLTPPVLKESMQVLEKLADVKAVSQGGYPQAERCRISVGHPDELTSDPDIISALSITGNFQFEPCSHGDFLGSVHGTGITRDKVGDIILQGEQGAQILIVPELVEFLMSALDKVRNVPVSCTRIPLISLDYEPPRTKSFKTVEASLRVDAVASAGFKISRSKLVDMISNGDVRINWIPVTTKGTTIKSGDIVSVSGKGRLKIGEINTTKKGKFAVELIQYL